MKNERNKTENINAKAFSEGSQGISLDDFEKELEAEFGKLREQKIADSVEKIKTLEAQTEVAQKRKDDAGERWKRLDALHEGRTLSLVKPALATLAAFVLVFAEGGLLAPTMDALNIADETIQRVVAAAMVLTLTVILEIAVHNFQQKERKLWLVIVPAAFSIITLAAFGWWRGAEAIFVAEEGGAGDFAVENSTLTKVFLTLISVGMPIAAAFSLDFGLKGLRLFWERFKARADFLKFSKETDENQKRLEAAQEKRAAELEKIAKDRESWISAARDSWAEGRRKGAWKLPFWQAVVFPTAVVGILTFVVVMTAGMVAADPLLAEFIEGDIFRVALFVLLSIGLTGLFAMHFIRKWNHPTDEELFNRRATHWQNAENPNSIRLFGEEKRPTLVGKTDDEWQGNQIAAAR